MLSGTVRSTWCKKAAGDRHVAQALNGFIGLCGLTPAAHILYQQKDTETNIGWAIALWPPSTLKVLHSFSATAQSPGRYGQGYRLRIFGAMGHMSTIKAILQQLKPELEQKYHVQSLALFGSVVRDDFNAGSDVDILVDFSAPIGVEFIDLAEYIERKLNRRVDLVSRNAIKEPYYKAIEREIVYV